jgi:hypothetical protein
MSTPHIARDAVVWLTDGQAILLLSLLQSGARQEAQQLLLSVVPDLPADLDEPGFVDELIEELTFRIVPPDDEDQDSVATREIPNYARFAHTVDAR